MTSGDIGRAGASPLLELHLANVVTWFVLHFAEGGRADVMGSISSVAKSILLFQEIVFLNHLFCDTVLTAHQIIWSPSKEGYSEPWSFSVTSFQVVR